MIKKIRIGKVYIVYNLFDQKQLTNISEQMSTNTWQVDENGNLCFNLESLKGQEYNKNSLLDFYKKNISILKSEIEKDFSCQLGQENHTSIVEYKKGWKLHPHVDSWSNLQTYSGYPSRDISSLVYLTDNFEGGKLFFSRLDIEVEPIAGSAIYFPSDDEHIHEVTEVLAGNRWVSTCFWHILDKKNINKEN